MVAVRTGLVPQRSSWSSSSPASPAAQEAPKTTDAPAPAPAMDSAAAPASTSSSTRVPQRVSRERAFGDAAQGARAAALQAQVPAARDLRRGDTGSDVEQLQRDLVQAGLMTNAQMSTGPGIFGPQTDAAVRQCQTNAGLPVNGVVDAATRRALANVNRQELRRGQTGNAVLALQQELAQGGLMTNAQLSTGPGIFGPQTEAAVRSAQQRSGLPVTGVVDVNTRRAIREIAGIPTGGAPTSPTSPTAPTSPTSPTPPSSPSAPGAISDVAQGNEHFRTQFFDPKWNPTGPNFSANCGPAAAAMVLSANGKMPAGLTNEQETDYARALMNPGHWATTTINVNGQAIPQLDRDHDLSSQTQISTAFQSVGGTGTHGAGWSALDTALAKGPVTVDGYYSKAGWGSIVENAGARQGSPGRAGSGEVGHLLTVMGKASDGMYLVADPMFTGGVVKMSRDELAVFCGDPTFVAFR